VQEQAQPKGDWLRLIGADRSFRLYIGCRVLVGLSSIAVPFYVGHAQDVLHLPVRTLGTFVIAQTVGWMVGSLGLGLISDRWGQRLVVILGALAALASPLFALAAPLFGVAAVAWLYPVVFFALGISGSAAWPGFFNYLISSVPANNRTTYVGLANTISGLLTLAPVLGGWLLQGSSYTVLFSLTAVLVGIGFLLTMRLRQLKPEGATPAATAPASEAS